MDFTHGIALLALGLFLGSLLFLELGRRYGLRRMAKDAEGARVGIGAIEAATFGLMGLLIAFTFSGAANRFDLRRQLVIQEANSIQTAYLRLDMLPTETQPALRESFRRYLDSRLEVYRRLPDIEAARAELARSQELQAGIWQQAAAACRQPGGQPVTMLVLPAVTQMIEVTNTQTLAAMIHPPLVIHAMLCALVWLGSLMAGYGMAGAKTRSWLHQVAFAAALAFAVFVILNLEYPRLGLIRIDPVDQVLVDLRASMK